MNRLHERRRQVVFFSGFGRDSRNCRRPTPSTRSCSTAWSFHAIDATGRFPRSSGRRPAHVSKLELMPVPPRRSALLLCLPHGPSGTPLNNRRSRSPIRDTASSPSGSLNVTARRRGAGPPATRPALAALATAGRPSGACACRGPSSRSSGLGPGRASSRRGRRRRSRLALALFYVQNPWARRAAR